jgi:hypothetical protein
MVYSMFDPGAAILTSGPVDDKSESESSLAVDESPTISSYVSV